ncbi:MAG: type I-E CRISPR-associated protein Cse1/CasA [Thermoanaerobaculia bacterium]
MTQDRDFGLLSDPLLTVQCLGREPALETLPGVLARLGTGEAIQFPRLQAHQGHAWHAFLVQLAALVAHRRGSDDLTLSEDAWRAALLELTAEAGGEAWHLRVDDLSKPAFFQNPVPEGDLQGYKDPTVFPDDMDVLLVARNHDVKTRRIAHPEPELWVYTLVTLQTMQGFLGRGNYGIARMNGGFSSRPCVGFAPSTAWPDRFARDVQVWLDTRPELTGEDYGYPEEGGLALLWLPPWDGAKESSRALTGCDPFFIEVCRRVRLVDDGRGRLECRRTNTQAPFLDAKHANGDTGDIWMPVGADGKALTVSGSGFDYQRLTRILFGGEYPRKPALEIREEDGPEPVLIAEVLVRGQGQTEGYHRRVIPVPPKARSRLLSDDEENGLGNLAEARVRQAGVARRDVLHRALCSLLQGGKDRLDFRDRRMSPWTERFDRAVDAVFFEDLWDAADLPPEEANRRWDYRLFELARAQFDHATEAAPKAEATGLRAEARSRLFFHALARKLLKGAFTRDDSEETTDDAA